MRKVGMDGLMEQRLKGGQEAGSIVRTLAGRPVTVQEEWSRWGVGLTAIQGFHLRSTLARQTDLQVAEDQQAALQQMIVRFFRGMRDNRNSLMYRIIQLQYSSHQP